MDKFQQEVILPRTIMYIIEKINEGYSSTDKRDVKLEADIQNLYYKNSIDDIDKGHPVKKFVDDMNRVIGIKILYTARTRDAVYESFNSVLYSTIAILFNSSYNGAIRVRHDHSDIKIHYFDQKEIDRLTSLVDYLHTMCEDIKSKAPNDIFLFEKLLELEELDALV